MISFATSLRSQNLNNSPTKRLNNILIRGFIQPGAGFSRLNKMNIGGFIQPANLNHGVNLGDLGQVFSFL